LILPPLVYGETTIRGIRGPSPKKSIGWMMFLVATRARAGKMSDGCNVGATRP
jgi:hypothetical protein